MCASFKMIKLKLDSSEKISAGGLTVAFVFVVVEVILVKDEGALFENVDVKTLLF